jgi:two-component system nitrate/nitrite response regulator NarL
VNTVAICDTEPVAIEGLRSLIGAAEEMRVVAVESSLSAVVEAARECQAEIVILDKAFGLQIVIEALRDLHTPESGIKAIVWGTTLSNAEALRLLHAGALGVLSKKASLECILDCLATVASGTTWMEDALPHSGELPVRSARTPLTTRELQVMELVEQGLTNRDIGGRLGIRTGTVKIHIKHIFEKTGIRGRYGLALCGLREKGMLLSPVVM